MKKITTSVVALLVMATVSFAQNSKMKSEKNETKKTTHAVSPKSATAAYSRTTVRTTNKMESKNEAAATKKHSRSVKKTKTETKAK